MRIERLAFIVFIASGAFITLMIVVASFLGGTDQNSIYGLWLLTVGLAGSIVVFLTCVGTVVLINFPAALERLDATRRFFLQFLPTIKRRRGRPQGHVFKRQVGHQDSVQLA